MKKNEKLVEIKTEMENNAINFNIDHVESKQLQAFKPCYLFLDNVKVGEKKQGINGFCGTLWKDVIVVDYNNNIYTARKSDRIFHADKYDIKSLDLNNIVFSEDDTIKKFDKLMNDLYYLSFNDNTNIYIISVSKKIVKNNFFSLFSFINKKSGGNNRIGFSYRDTCLSREKLINLVKNDLAKLVAVETIEKFLRDTEEFQKMQVEKLKKINFGKIIEGVLSGYEKDVISNRSKVCDCWINKKKIEIKSSLSLDKSTSSNSNFLIEFK